MDQQQQLDNVEQLSDAQEKALALLPLPSAVLSILGSSVIIFTAFYSKREQKWTPYTRLLIMMSLSDILFSSTIGIGAFLRPHETSTRAWAFGTASTCSAVGFLNQLATSSVLYNAMLSAYFLLTARFNFKNSFIATSVEPWMHFIAIGFPFLTAIVGAAVGEYGEMTLNGLVCWLTKFPTNCGYGPGESGQECLSKFVGWVFYGLPVLVTFVTIITNSVILVLFVQKQALPPQSGNYQARRDQKRRLRLVRTQACLFLASFSICIFWTGVLNSVESIATSKQEELALVKRFFPVSVIQAIFMPLQGFLNMFVYLRPKYLKARQEYPNETRSWAFRRSIFGDEIQPTQAPPPIQDAKVERVNNNMKKKKSDRQKNAMVGAFDSNEVEFYQDDYTMSSTSNTDGSDYYYRYGKKQPSSKKVSKKTMSSLTASMGDFDHVLEEDQPDERWETGDHDSPTPVVRHFHSSLIEGSSLEVISEHAESVFEPIRTPPLHSCSVPPMPPPLDLAQGRWSDSSNAMEPLAPPVLRAPSHEDDEDDEEEDEQPRDAPIRAPSRRLSEDYSNEPQEEQDLPGTMSEALLRFISGGMTRQDSTESVEDHRPSSMMRRQDSPQSLELEPLANPLLVRDLPIRAPARHASEEFSIEQSTLSPPEEELPASIIAAPNEATVELAAVIEEEEEEQSTSSQEGEPSSNPMPAAAAAASQPEVATVESPVIFPSQRRSISRRQGPAYFTAMRH